MALPGNKHNIVLTGFMGTGKSAVGRELARLTGFALTDLDARIEAAEGRTISEIFARDGEPAFRDMEAREAARAASGKSQVISTGGGVVLRAGNMDALSADGVIVCLAASPELIYERTSHHDNRPLLKEPDPMAKIVSMLREREPFYKRADLTINTDGKSPYELALEILEAVGWKR